MRERLAALLLAALFLPAGAMAQADAESLRAALERFSQGLQAHGIAAGGRLGIAFDLCRHRVERGQRFGGVALLAGAQ